MQLGEDGLTLITHFEGLGDGSDAPGLQPYKDPIGLWTIGYGHLIKEGESFDTISVDEALSLLYKDVVPVTWGVRRLITVDLTQAQFDALVDFAYNLGNGALQASTLRRKLNRGDYYGASQEFKRWVYAGGRKLPGLVRRREAESLLFLGEESWKVLL